MANPGTYNFTIYRGLTFSRVITYYQADGVTPVDLTNATVEWKIKPSVGYPTNTGDYTTTPEITVDPTHGKITLALTATETKALAEGNYVYSLNVTNGSTVDGLILGSVSIISTALA